MLAKFQFSFGCYDDTNSRFILTANCGAPHGKKVLVVDRHGRLDSDFGTNKNGIQNVPEDIVQIAGICPVIKKDKKFHGYIICDGTGRKLIHMNKHGHIAKVFIFEKKKTCLSCFFCPQFSREHYFR